MVPQSKITGFPTFSISWGFDHHPFGRQVTVSFLVRQYGSFSRGPSPKMVVLPLLSKHRPEHGIVFPFGVPLPGQTPPPKKKKKQKVGGPLPHTPRSRPPAGFRQRGQGARAPCRSPRRGPPPPRTAPRSPSVPRREGPGTGGSNRKRARVLRKPWKYRGCPFWGREG